MPTALPTMLPEYGACHEGQRWHFAPHGINVVIMVILRSLSCSIVREAIIPGTPQPVPTSIGMKLFPERPETSENTVHDECDTCHISAVLQYAQHKEKYQHLRYEAENRAYARNNTVNQVPQAMALYLCFPKPLNGSTIHSPTKHRLSSQLRKYLPL